ncbi:MAG: hypothetical protein ACE5NP_03910 [Anaerolineae bacterium]
MFRTIYGKLSVLVTILLVGSLLALSLLLWPENLSELLENWTGEEEVLPQIRGLLHLVSGAMRRQPRTLPYVPVAHTGVNPLGINTFLEQEVEPAKVEQALSMISRAGFKWIRQEFPWEDIEIHAKGDFEDRRHPPPRSAWEKYDRIVDLAEKHGLGLIVRLGNPPAWSRAAGDEAGTFAPPDDYQDFGDFVYTVVTRYRGRIKYYQIWNEPNIYPEWGEQPVNAAEYTALLKVGYTRAKEADPEVVILSASLAPTIELGPRDMNDFIFLQQMYDAGAKDYFDILSIQDYGLWSGPGDRRMRPRVLNFSRPVYIREIMVANDDEHKPIWASEVGWNAIPFDHPAYPQFGRVSDEQLARYAVGAYQRAQADWPWMGVLNFWFFKRATDLEREQPFYYFRMVEPDFTPMPVYQAMKEYAHQKPVVFIGYHQEDHWALHYQGGWRSVKDEYAVLGGYRATEKAGDSLSFTFRGTGLDLVVLKGRNSGMLQVTLDGQDLGEIDLRAPEGQYQVEIPIARGLVDREHQVRFQAVGKGRVAIDGLIVRRDTSYRWHYVLGGVLAAGSLGFILYFWQSGLQVVSL